MKYEYLRSFPPMPAIRESMVKAAKLREEGVPIYDFSSGSVGNLLFKIQVFKDIKIEMNDGLPKPLEIITEGIQKGLLDSLFPVPRGLGYSPTTGTTEQKKEVIKYMRKIHGLSLADEDIDRVACTAGGQLAMAASLRAIKPGTDVFMPRWDYSPISGIVKNNECNLTRVKMHDDLSLDLDDLKEKVSDKSVFYLSMPNNPTGYTSVEDLNYIFEVMKTRKGGVIWDAPYLFTILELTPKIEPTKARFRREFLDNIKKKFKKLVEKDSKNICILSSLSKSCLIAGLRFGFVSANKQWIANIEALIGRENLSAPTLSFIVGTHMLRKFLENPIAHEWTCKVLANRITILLEEEMPVILPKNGVYGALYALIRTPTDGKKFADKLLKKGMVTVPGSAFYGEPVNAVRLSLVAVPWVDGDKNWIESVKALKQALD